MPTCSVPGCKSIYKKQQGIGFHKFPSNREKLCELWLKAIGAETWIPNKNSRICEEHFKDSDYCRQYVRNGQKIKVLTKNAVPSINLPKSILDSKMKPSVINYCCVLGCNLNSENSPSAIFHSLNNQNNCDLYDSTLDENFSVLNKNLKICDQHFHSAQLLSVSADNLNNTCQNVLVPGGNLNSLIDENIDDNFSLDPVDIPLAESTFFQQCDLNTEDLNNDFEDLDPVIDPASLSLLEDFDNPFLLQKNSLENFQQKDIYDLDNICRVCLNEGDMKDISTDSVHDILIRDMLEKCIKYKNFEDEKMPKQICLNCAAELTFAYDFIKKCEHSYEFLLKYISIQNVSFKTAAEMEHDYFRSSLPEMSPTLDIEALKDVISRNLDSQNLFTLDDSINIEKESLTKLLDEEKQEENDLLDNAQIKELINLSEELNEKEHALSLKNIEYENKNTLNYSDVNDFKNSSNDLKNVQSVNKIQIQENDQEFIIELFAENLNTDEIENNTNMKNEINVLSKQKESNDDIVEETLDNDTIINQANNILSLDKNYSLQMNKNNIVTYKNKKQSRNSKITTQIDIAEAKIKENSIIVGKAYSCKKCNVLFLDNETHCCTKNENIVVKCLQCNQSFISKKDLIEHNKINHAQENVVVCEICHKKMSSEAYKTHKLFHNLEFRFCCEYCGKRYQKSRTFYCHLKSHRNVNRFVCSICGRGFNSKTKESEHRLTHSQNNTYMCHKCGRNFRQKVGLLQHIRKKRCVKLNTQGMKYKCSQTNCNESFNTRRHLDKHNRQSHMKRMNMKCEICNINLETEELLKKHMEIHLTICLKEIDNVSDPNLLFSCNTCNKTFRSQEFLSTHMKSHNGKKFYHCPICSKRFFRQSHLDIHSRIHLNTKELKCWFCDRKFSFVENMKTHMRNHFIDKNQVTSYPKI